MTAKDKLKLIKGLSGLTQTQIAGKLGISFVAFNNIWNGKSKPRTGTLEKIDLLYKEYTGQKIIPADMLSAKKQLLIKSSKKHGSIIRRILNNKDIYDQLLLTLTYNTNRIEGSTLTEDDTADILFGNRTLPDHSLTEHLEVKNHQFALKYLLDWVAANSIIDETIILKLHGILMNGIRSDAGTYRRHGVRILGAHVPTANHIKVPVLIERLLFDINSNNKDIILLVTEIHSRFEQIHPFSDGNGRIGRLLMNAMLLIKKMPPAVIKQENKRQYYICLQKAQLNRDNTLLQDFICDAVISWAKMLDREFI
ncbi:MAG: Fic family protein [Candidatus Margulisiibacteriota bacterium]